MSSVGRRPFLVVAGIAAALALTTAWGMATGRLTGVGAILRGAPAGPASPSASTQSGPAPTPTAASSGEATEAERRLFAVAHEGHFVTRDPPAALRAWDAYLEAYPAGHFALEARFDRALTLVRLGQLDEARTALTAFANGEAGGYRQREARELLEAIP